LFALRLRELADRDQAAPLLEAVAPHEAVELVRPRVVDRLGLAPGFHPLEPQREPPDHRADLALAVDLPDDHTLVAGVDFPRAGVGVRPLRRKERRNLGRARLGGVEIADVDDPPLASSS